MAGNPDDTIGRYGKVEMKKALTALLTLIVLCMGNLPAVSDSPASDKRGANGSDVSFEGMIVTATLDDCCYIQTQNRAWGIRAVGPGVYPQPGDVIDVVGALQTNSDGEKYIAVTDGETVGNEDPRPLGGTNRSLGGADFSFDEQSGAGQRGVTGGAGLNNIGLLVRTTGTSTYIDVHTFTIDDGSGTPITCVTPSSMLSNPEWERVAVTGISSIRKSGETYERLLRVTKVDPIVSQPSEGITGRWEMTHTSGASGDIAGVYGMLLTQQGSTVQGSMRGLTIADGTINGNVFTGDIVGDSFTIPTSLTLSGDTLSGTWLLFGEVVPVTFHRVSTDPVSPYFGRPQVLNATCDGSAIHITWDRPINGWDFGIEDADGHSIVTEWDQATSYEPATHTYHIELGSSAIMVPGATYTVYLDGGDGIEWYDPYGTPAWDDPDDCYSFPYTCSVASPVITSFTPAEGIAGTVVSISGSQLAGATSVTFGGVPAMGFAVQSGSITATVPLGATSGQIAVTTPAGTAISSNDFTVIASGGGQPGDDAAIRAVFESAKTTFETHDLAALMALISPNFLQDGDDKAELQSNLQDAIDSIVSCSYTISNIAISGDRAIVTASMSVTFADQPSVEWTEPLMGNNGLAMGWLVKENGQWLMCGNQRAFTVWLYTWNRNDGWYHLGAEVPYGGGVVSATVEGPRWSKTTLHDQGDHLNAIKSFPISELPTIGDIYTFDVAFADGHHELMTDTVRSFVAATPSLTATPSGSTSIDFTWTNINAQVPNIRSYGVAVEKRDEFGYRSRIWRSRDYTTTTFSATFNDDGTASEPLQSGETYWCELIVYDQLNDATSVYQQVTMP